MKAIALLTLLVFAPPPAALGLVHTWWGDVNTSWATVGNWGNGVPRSDSVLLFPEDAQRRTNVNSLLNLEFNALSLVGSRYQLGGSPCFSRSGVSSINATTNGISLSLRTGGRITVSHPQGRLVFSGALTLQTLPGVQTVREIHSAGYVELRGQVNARERVVANGSTNWLGCSFLDPCLLTLRITGGGAVEFSGSTNNTYGATILEETTLYLNKTGGNSIPDTLTIGDYGLCVVVRPNQIDDDANVSIVSLGRLTVQGAEAINRLEGIGNVTLDGADLTVGSGGSSFTFGGRIVGTGGLVKTGIGTMTLDQTHNYSGPTILRGGSLLVNGNISSSPFYLASGTVGGDGRMGSVSVTNGTLAPGLGGSSTKLRMNTLGMASAGRLLWRQDANGQSGLIVDGTVTLNNSQLEIIAHSYFAPSNGQVITLIDNRGSQAVQGHFSNVPANGNMLITDSANRTYRLRYNGGDGNNVTLTFTNAPMQLPGSQPVRLSGGNGNAILDPGECVHLVCLISGTATNTITGVVADLRCDAEGVFVLQPHTQFGDLTPGLDGISKLAFQISTTTNLTCRTNIPFRLVVRSTSHGAVTIPFTLQTGCAPGTGPCEGCIATARNTIFGRVPTHQGVLIPSGDGDACASANTCPTFIDAPGIVRRYHLYSFTNTFYPFLDNCFTLYLTSLSGERLMATVYRDSFNPGALCSSNFVVCTPGLAERSTEQCRFRWTYGVAIRVVVTEFDGTGNAAPYELRLAGRICHPELNIEKLPNDRVRLSWPTTAPSFELEALPELGSTPQPLGLAPHVWNGRFVKTNSTTGPSHQFFRLVLPRP